MGRGEKMAGTASRNDRKRRPVAYHEAGHAAAFVALGFGIPDAIEIEIDPRGDELGRMIDLGQPIVGPELPWRRRRAILLLAGYVAQRRARGLNNAKIVQYCRRRSQWLYGKPFPDGRVPSGFSQHDDIDRVALLYSPPGSPRPLHSHVLRALLADTTAIVNTPFVWKAIDDLAQRVLMHNSLNRDGIVNWYHKFPDLFYFAFKNDLITIEDCELDDARGEFLWVLHLSRSLAFRPRSRSRKRR
jgi:hypothetical protein